MLSKTGVNKLILKTLMTHIVKSSNVCSSQESLFDVAVKLVPLTAVRERVLTNWLQVASDAPPPLEVGCFPQFSCHNQVQRVSQVQ